MKRQLLFLFCLFAASFSQQTMIQSVGVIIYYQPGSGDRLKSYIKQFHDPICTTVSEFIIVITPEAEGEIEFLQIPLKLLQKVIPIHYIFTSKDQNTHYRLQFAKNSKAEVYYISSMNIAEQSCNNIENIVFLVQGKSFAGLIGLVGQHDSLSSVASDLTKVKNQFTYTKETPQHFAIVQNIRIISKHILQLANSNISEIVKMRNQTVAACEEIFLNFVASHFYPELRPSFEAFNSSLKYKITDQDPQKKKNKCLRSYIDTLGYLPLFYHRKEFTKKLWQNPNLPKIIQLKKSQLNSHLQKNKQQNRLLKSSSSIITAQPNPSENIFSLEQQEEILKVFRITLVGLVLVAIALGIQFLILSAKEKRNRSQ